MILSSSKSQSSRSPAAGKRHGHVTAIGSQYGRDPGGCSKCSGFPSRGMHARQIAAAAQRFGVPVLRSAQKKHQVMSAALCSLPPCHPCLPTLPRAHKRLAWHFVHWGRNCHRPQPQRRREERRRPHSAESHWERTARMPAGRGGQLGDAAAEAMQRKTTSGSISQASLARRPRTWLGVSVDAGACSSAGSRLAHYR